jgi:hypothetical protein
MCIAIVTVIVLESKTAHVEAFSTFRIPLTKDQRRSKIKIDPKNLEPDQTLSAAAAIDFPSTLPAV